MNLFGLTASLKWKHSTPSWKACRFDANKKFYVQYYQVLAEQRCSLCKKTGFQCTDKCIAFWNALKYVNVVSVRDMEQRWNVNNDVSDASGLHCLFSVMVMSPKMFNAYSCLCQHEKAGCCKIHVRQKQMCFTFLLLKMTGTSLVSDQWHHWLALGNITNQWHLTTRSQPKIWGGQHFDFKRATVFCLGHRLSAQNDKICKNF